MSRLLAVVLLALTALPLANASTRAQTTDDKSTQLKAIFLYQFTRYIKWPVKVPADGSKPDFVIGVLGDTPIAKVLKLIAKRKTVYGRKIVVKRFPSRDKLGPCQMLVLASDQRPLVGTIMKSVTSRATLVVGDAPGMAIAGTHVNFVVKNKRMKFALNLETLRATDLKVSAQLKKLALIVKK